MKYIPHLLSNIIKIALTCLATSQMTGGATLANLNNTTPTIVIDNTNDRVIVTAWIPIQMTPCNQQPIPIHGSPSTDSIILNWLIPSQPIQPIQIIEWSLPNHTWAMIAPARWIDGRLLCSPEYTLPHPN